MAAPGMLLAGIANPAQVDVLGAMDKGKERQATDMAGDILGQSIGGQIGKLAKIDPDKAIKVAELTNTPVNDKGRIDNLLGTVITTTKLWDAGLTDDALSTLQKQIDFTEAHTGVPADKLRLAYDSLAAGGTDESGQGFLSVGRNIDPSNKGEGYTLSEGQIRYDSRGRPIAANIKEGGGIDPDFLKEERKIGSQTVASLKKRAGDIQSSYGKVEGLIDQIKNDKSRIASGAAIMNLARLISPGVVTDQDFKTMSGAASPLATALALVGGRDPDLAKDLQRYADPTNPELVDADSILKVAGSVVGSEAPIILGQLDEAEQRGKRSGMNQRQYDTIFGGTGSIRQLSKFVPLSDEELLNKY